MAKINILPPSVFNRIAAGEVVENPSSIVKELIENSIDAGATDIEVSILEGGIKEISVIDNGSGIERAYINEAFLPHATSKISSENDLHSISTLGFRGEALASIAAVSYVEMLTKNDFDDTGSLIIVKGGEIEKVTGCAREKGTSVTVTNLFYNTPARYKFLKSTKKEEANVTALIQKTILSNPFIKIKYIVDKKTVFSSHGEGLFYGIKAIYDSEIYSKMIFVQYKKYGVEIEGYIGEPTLYKSNRTYQTVIINGRFVNDAVLSSAVSTAYKDYLMKGNFPIFVLRFTIPFDLIDVNVHPHKTEVRFAKGVDLYGIVVSALKNALLDFSETQSEKLYKQYFVGDKPKNIESEKNKEELKNISEAPLSLDEYINSIPINQTESSVNEGDSLFQTIKTFEGNKNIDAPENIISDDFKNETPAAEISDFKIIGQLFDTYILIERKESFYIIDQHACHERFIYDKLVKEVNEKNMVVQPLFVPYILNFSPTEFAFIKENLDLINSLGIDAMEFSNNCIKISGLPDTLLNLNIDKYFSELTRDMYQLRLIKDSSVLKEKLMQKACKAAIKGGDVLGHDQIKMILSTLIKDGFPMQCPHGRPTIIEVAKAQIEKWFRRTL